MCADDAHTADASTAIAVLSVHLIIKKPTLEK